MSIGSRFFMKRGPQYFTRNKYVPDISKVAHGLKQICKQKIQSHWMVDFILFSIFLVKNESLGNQEVLMKKMWKCNGNNDKNSWKLVTYPWETSHPHACPSFPWARCRGSPRSQWEQTWWWTWLIRSMGNNKKWGFFFSLVFANFLSPSNWSIHLKKYYYFHYHQLI